MEGAQVQSPALAALEASSFLAASNEVDDEDLDMARWECRRLEKRLAQARSYNCELLQDLERKPAMSTNASEDLSECIFQACPNRKSPHKLATFSCASVFA
eukprot:g25080.t1